MKTKNIEGAEVKFSKLLYVTEYTSSSHVLASAPMMVLPEGGFL